MPLLLILTIQAKLGPINILAERAMQIWDGSQQGQVGNTNNESVRLANNLTPGIHQVSRADTLDNTIN